MLIRRLLRFPNASSYISPHFWWYDCCRAFENSVVYLPLLRLRTTSALLTGWDAQPTRFACMSLPSRVIDAIFPRMLGKRGGGSSGDIAVPINTSVRLTLHLGTKRHAPHFQILDITITLVQYTPCFLSPKRSSIFWRNIHQLSKIDGGPSCLHEDSATLHSDHEGFCGLSTSPFIFTDASPAPLSAMGYSRSRCGKRRHRTGLCCRHSRLQAKQGTEDPRANGEESTHSTASLL